VGNNLVGKIKMVSTQFHEAQVSENNLDLYVRAFAANSHRGNVKPFNEDRISIITKLSPRVSRY
jgi:hypothetical protein